MFNNTDNIEGCSMRNRIYLMFSVLCVLASSVFGYNWSDNPGNGSEAKPYQISEPIHLLAINNIDTTGVHFILTSDIDLAPALPGNQIFDRAVIASDVVFDGTFDGDDFCVKNLKMEAPDYEYPNFGVFGIVGTEGCVKNLHVHNFEFTGIYAAYDVGGLAGQNLGAIVSCSASGTIDLVYVYGSIGGLVGFNGDYYEENQGLIANSTSTITIRHKLQGAGGFVGQNSGSIHQCWSQGHIQTRNNSGSFAAYNSGVINRCYSKVMMDCDSESGGFVASNHGLIKDSYCIGADYSTHNAGFAREMYSYSNSTFPRIERCYATVHDSLAGGLISVGGICIGGVLASFWDTEVCGTIESDGGKGLTTAQMKDSNAYIKAGWDFVGETTNGAEDIWQIDPNINDGYPSLIFKPIDGGDGSAANPYIIYTKQQLLDFFNDSSMWDKHIKLIANIDLSNITFTSSPIGTFNGIFDGSGCTISGLAGAPLIDIVSRSGKVQNLYVKDAAVTTGGSIIAVLNVGQIIDCHVQGTVQGGEYDGGLVSINESVISRCSADCQVGSGLLSIGGLVGLNSFFGVVRESFSSGSVDSSSAGFNGGLVGQNRGRVEHCYSTASVAGSNLAGALVGSNELGVVMCCYATGPVEGDELICFNALGVVAHSYYGGYMVFPQAWEGNSWYEEDGHIWTTNNCFPGQLFLKWQQWGTPLTAQMAGYIPEYRMDPTREGSAEHPYLFNFELADFPADWDKHFVLTEDVDMTDVCIPDIDKPVIPYFNGTLDGSGHVIRKMRLENLTDNRTMGFFGMLGYNAVVKQLGIEGELNYLGRFPALFAGINFGTLRECYAKGDLTCDTYGGILTGFNGGTIRDCYAEGMLTLSHILTETWDETPIVGGGLYGRSWGRVINSYVSVETVYPGDYIYSGVGGLNEGLVWNSYWNNDLTDPKFILGGNPLTTEQMKHADSFIGWGDNIWKIADGNDTPRLMWENTDWVWTPENPEPPACWWEDNCPEYVPIVDAPRNYGGGDGTAESPYVLTASDHLFTLGKHLSDCDKYFVIGNNIDVSGQTLNESVIGYFTGHFNGAGHAIEGLNINSIFQQYPPHYHIYTSAIGLFGCVDTGGVVENLAIKNVNINGMCTVGALAGENNGTIRRSFATGNIRAEGNVGGLVGSNGFRKPYGTAQIEDCYTDASVVGDALQGYAMKYLGGIAGASNGTINRCYASGSIDAYNEIWAYSPFITGGIAGWSSGGDISNCYYFSIAGENPAGTQIDSTQMKQRITFTNWDFTGDTNGNQDIWRMCADGMSYPRLSWEFSQGGDYACPDGVGLDDLAAIGENWLTLLETQPETFNYACDANGDGTINLVDFSVLSANWLAN